ncbi:hypothetical protein BXZ70DRAFT_445544 [Cristinia sonorae]|uniref:Protein-S-isoprenylcysteine O-methyltransferase n=1 Tax=Cristinia sonorae TaxID=1940300 RepID=A0A8K0UHV4_9AGAR|nr:hypothetical protein BXZ70DRAFT_445544 [Cristinia sonorae]
MSNIPPSLYRLPFVIANLAAGQIAILPPTKSAPQTEQNKYVTKTKSHEYLSAVMWWFLPTIWTFMYAIHIAEVYIVLAAAYPPLRSPTLLGLILPPNPSLSSLSRRLEVSPAYLFATAISVVGGGHRRLCFVTLGRHFTFELSVKRDHKLITYGPYTVVRHPAYTAILIHYLGLLLTVFGLSSWWSEADVWRTTLGVVVGGLWLVMVVFMLTSLVRRVPKEDKVMRDEFRQEWVEWSKKTPYALIPWLY